MFAVAGRSMEERVAVTVICWLTAEGWRVRSTSLAAVAQGELDGVGFQGARGGAEGEGAGGVGVVQFEAAAGIGDGCDFAVWAVGEDGGAWAVRPEASRTWPWRWSGACACAAEARPSSHTADVRARRARWRWVGRFIRGRVEVRLIGLACRMQCRDVLSKAL